MRLLKEKSKVVTVHRVNRNNPDAQNVKTIQNAKRFGSVRAGGLLIRRSVVRCPAPLSICGNVLVQETEP